MANFERGVYEPGDEAHEGIRVYDGSEDEEDVEGSRLPLLIVLALLIVINVRQSRDEKRREAARRKGAMQP